MTNLQKFAAFTVQHGADLAASKGGVDKFITQERERMSAEIKAPVRDACRDTDVQGVDADTVEIETASVEA